MRTSIIIFVAVVLIIVAFLVLRKRPAQPELVQVEVGEDQIREQLKGSRDFRIRVDLDATVTAHCKSCNAAMRTAEQDGIVWFKCPECKLVSLYSSGNITRDTHFANKDGKPLEYELFFMRDVPPELKPPF